MRIQEVSSLQPGKGLSPEPERAGALLTDFQNCEKQIPVVYKPPSSWYLVIIAQKHYDDLSLRDCHQAFTSFPPSSAQNLLWREPPGTSTKANPVLSSQASFSGVHSPGAPPSSPSILSPFSPHPPLTGGVPRHNPWVSSFLCPHSFL